MPSEFHTSINSCLSFSQR